MSAAMPASVTGENAGTQRFSTSIRFSRSATLISGSARGAGLLWLVLAFSLRPAPLLAQSGRTVTLEEAWRLAAELSPALRAERARTDEARGRLLSARALPFLPVISVSQGKRSGPDGRTTDTGGQLSQEFEIGGQRGQRIAAAEAELVGAEELLGRNQRLLAGLVALAFGEAVRARELQRIEEADAALAEELLAFERRRLEAGKSTAMDLNLARAAAGRSLGRLALARGESIAARGALAEIIGLDGQVAPEVAGPLVPGSVAPALPDLLRQARTAREDLRAADASLAAANARLSLARREAIPNLVLQAFSEREASSETINGGGASVGIPLFRRQRGAVAEARAIVERTQAEIDILRRAIDQEVVAALARFEAARAAAAGLEEHVIGSLDENLRLLQQAVDAGKIGRTELFLFRREFVESQREYLEATTAAWRARVDLDVATGQIALPTSSNRSPS